MGDRANVYVHSGEQPGVYLYTHWAGTELPETVRAALKRAAVDGRVDDEPYLTRIIFSEMIKDNVMGTTGYGISAYVNDGDDRVTDVDVESRTVRAPGHAPVKITDYIAAGQPAPTKPKPTEGDRETEITLTVGPVIRRK